MAPGSATATVAPAPKFQAPHTIWYGSLSPTSTTQSWSRSAFGCFAGLEHLADAEEAEVAVLVRDAAPLDRGDDRAWPCRAASRSSSTGISSAT